LCHNKFVEEKSGEAGSIREEISYGRDTTMRVEKKKRKKEIEG